MPCFPRRAARQASRGPGLFTTLAATLALLLHASCGSDPIDDGKDAKGGSTSRGGATSQAGTLNSNTPVMCSSNQRWTGGDRGSALMHPGRACFTCHPSRNQLEFAVAGTIYPSAHEPDDCNGVNAASGAIIRLTDGDGVQHELKANDAGNFYLPGRLPPPFRASVIRNGLERAMVTPQMSGDCNHCHSETGAEGSPGRIVAP